MLEEAFWRSIQEAPDDDAPRLIYADWLDEQGSPAQVARAEFIRVQCELARLPDDSDRRGELEKREGKLWAKHGKEWRAPLRPFSQKILFRRGFPDEVLVQGKTFLAHAEEVLAAAPVFSIRLRNSKEQIPEIAKLPALRRLISLSLYFNHLGMKRTQILCESPHLINLVELDFDDNEIRREGLRAVTQADLPRLKSLNLRANLLEDDAMEVLAGSEFLARLHTLELTHNPFTDAGVATLAASPHVAGLKTLDLGTNEYLGDGSAIALAESPHLGGLASLSLGGSPYPPRRNETPRSVTEAGARALASSSTLSGLTDLVLRWQRQFGDAGARALWGSTTLTGLKALTLSTCGIKGTELGALEDSAFAASLTSLDLSDNHFGDEAAEAIAAAPLPGLRRLSLSDNNLGKRGATALAKSPHLAGLVHLNLIRNQLTDAGVEALAKSPHLTRLRSLLVTQRWFGEKARAALVARFGKDVVKD
jgi:uncharacterized protein (TIGR02996 family)